MAVNAGAPEDPNLVIREPRPAELGRAIYVFQHLPPPPGSQLFVGVRLRPVERLVIAGAGWIQGNVARFRLACQPGVARATVSGPLIQRLEEWARSSGTNSLEYADLLADENDLAATLQEHGFHCARSERFFEVSTRKAYDRVMALVKKFQADIPAGWRTESIRTHSPETILGLVSPHRLLPLSELQEHWRAGFPFGFDMDLSSILFDGRQVFGTQLWRRTPQAYIIDVRVVACDNPRLRALGNLCLFLHACQRGDPDGPVRWLQFRGGETEHRETANLAIRMGGQELPPRRVFGKTL